MGVGTRGLDINAGAARLEAELVDDRWNRRLATSRNMLWSPTIRAAGLRDRRQQPNSLNLMRNEPLRATAAFYVLNRRPPPRS
jgi:hypothetical protein